MSAQPQTGTPVPPSAVTTNLSGNGNGKSNGNGNGAVKKPIQRKLFYAAVTTAPDGVEKLHLVSPILSPMMKSLEKLGVTNDPTFRVLTGESGLVGGIVATYMQWRGGTIPKAVEALEFMVSEMGEVMDALVHNEGNIMDAQGHVTGNKWSRNNDKTRDLDGEVADVVMMAALYYYAVGKDLITELLRRLAEHGYPGWEGEFPASYEAYNQKQEAKKAADEEKADLEKELAEFRAWKAAQAAQPATQPAPVAAVVEDVPF